MMHIDLNCDCGESYGAWPMGDDGGILPMVSSANIACGAHAGDPDVMRATLRLARELGVKAGAHPGFADRQGFGRRLIPLTPDEVFNSVLSQVGALAALARAESLRLQHVKAHGALYNHAAVTPPIAQAIAEAVATFDRELIMVGLAGSALLEAGRAAGLRVAAEAFVDRTYEADGKLRSRRLPGAMILDEAAGLEQALSIIERGEVRAYSGEIVGVQADSICLHGDAPGATARGVALRRGLEAAGVAIVAMAEGIEDRRSGIGEPEQ
jgi:5-oxoprolinase (ATP-hydrolysing) subunit A